MEHLVVKVFSDKELGKLFLPSSYFNCEDLEKINSLSSLGFIIPNDHTKTLEKPVEEVKPESKSTRKTSRSKAVDKDVAKG